MRKRPGDEARAVSFEMYDQNGWLWMAFNVPLFVAFEDFWRS